MYGVGNSNSNKSISSAQIDIINIDMNGTTASYTFNFPVKVILFNNNEGIYDSYTKIAEIPITKMIFPGETSEINIEISNWGATETYSGYINFPADGNSASIRFTQSIRNKTIKLLILG